MALAYGGQRQLRTVRYPAEPFAKYCDLLPAVLAALPEDEEYVLLGWSFSGPLALLAASTRPPGLKGVALVSTFVQKPLAYMPRAASWFARPALFRCFSHLARLKARLGGYSSAELRALMKEAHASTPPAVLASRVRMSLAVDVRTELAECPVPILCIAASHDRVVPPANARMIERLRPDARVREVAGPHLALATAPMAVARELEDFCAALTRG